jgi:hypothetical protein
MNFVIGWPEGLYIAWSLIANVGIAHLHGRDRSGKHSYPVTFAATGIGFLVLLWGGFFS